MYTVDVTTHETTSLYTHIELLAQYCVSLVTGQRLFDLEERGEQDVWCHTPQIKGDDCVGQSQQLSQFLRDHWMIEEQK